MAKERKKLGLALGGGVARGLAHIGVLEVLDKESITIDMIAGTSAGAVIGAIYAQTKDTNVVRDFVRNLSHKRLISLVDPSLPKTGLIKGEKIIDLLKVVINKSVRFSDLKIPFACIATDIMNGEEVVISQGSVLDGIRASISIPLIFTAARWRGKYLVDGGLVNPVPVSTLKGMGADFIIAVNVIPNIKTELVQSVPTKAPNILDIIMHSMYIGNTLLVRHSLEGANIRIEPQVRHISAGDFHKVEECILEGKKAAEASISMIRNLLM
ncbi:patatin-like phospholipase family protein [Chloroflexota bacterium]